MKKIVFVILITLLPISYLLAQQDYSNKFDLKVGAGLVFMGWGDVTVVGFENELNYKINNYFSTAVSYGIGRGNHNDGFKRQDNYLQGSVNVFVSPFKNNRRNNFRIGGGYTYINEVAAGIGSILYYPYEETYYIDEYSVHCYNVIIEDEFKITTRLIIGAKFFVMGNIREGYPETWGGMLKFGVVL